MKTDTRIDCEQKWLEAFGAGIAALEAGNLKSAIKNLEGAVDLAGQLGLIDQFTDSLLALGDAQRMSGQYQAAETSIKKAVDFSFEHSKNNKISYALSLGGLGRLCIEQDRTDEAIQFLEMAVNILRRNRSSAEPEFLTVFLALITCYLEKQEFDKADKLSRYTYELSKSLVGESDTATVMAMTMCAASASALGKQRRADILKCQIGTIMRDSKKMGASDELGIAAAMLRQLNINGAIDTRPVVLSLGDEEEVVWERDIPTFGGSSTKKSRKERQAVEPKQYLRIMIDE